MRPSELGQALFDVIPTGRPIHIEGPPGVGKSRIAQQTADRLFAEEYGLKFDGARLRNAKGEFTDQRHYLIDLRAALLDPVDLRGLPTINGNRTIWTAPDFLPLEGTEQGDRPGIIFCDELAQAVPLVQGSLLQGIQDHAFGSHRISRKWKWVAASNRQEDRAGGHRIISSLQNRFLHLSLEVHPDDWMDWALAASIHPMVRSYIKLQPQALFQFDPNAGARAFPTPRSWEFVSDILPVTKPSNLYDLVKGCVGDGQAVQFKAHYELYGKLPDIDRLLANPKNAPVSADPDIAWAVNCAIAAKAKANPKLVTNAAEYSLRLPKEFGTMLMLDMIKVDPAVMRSDPGRAFLKLNGDALIAARD